MSFLKVSFLMILILVVSNLGYSMHISEGVLSLNWTLFWIALSLPFLIWSILVVISNIKSKRNYIAVISFIGAVVFLMSSLAIPSPVAGSVSHPAATGISSIIIGPVASVFVGFMTLVIQALFMAHGGITSLGANTFAMAVIGSFVGFGTYKLARLLKLSHFIAGFMAGFFADILTYMTTAFQLALEFHGSEPITTVWITLFGLFLPIQLPVSVLEGIVAGIIVKVFVDRARDYIDPIVEPIK